MTQQYPIGSHGWQQRPRSQYPAPPPARGQQPWAPLGAQQRAPQLRKDATFVDAIRWKATVR